MQQRISYSTTAILLLFLSCEDPTIESPFEYQVDLQAQAYVDSFFEVLATRDHPLSRENLRLQFVDVINQVPGACGLAADSAGQNIVYINQGCWTELDDIGKEKLIFHELGHSLLDRGHTEDVLPNGRKKSIMLRSFGGTYDVFTADKRDYYLDELVDPNTPAPAWAVTKPNQQQILSDGFESTPIGWEYWVRFPQTNRNGYEGTVIDDVFALAPPSISIKAATNADYQDRTRWFKWVDDIGLPANNDLILKVKVRTENLVGPGATVSLEAGTLDNSYNQYEFIVIESIGSNFTEYTVAVTDYPFQVDYLDISLALLPNTVGRVYFDDVVVIRATN